MDQPPATQPQRIAAAKANGVKAAGGAGFAYIRGPDDAMIEIQGDLPAERFNHVHMFQDDPFCAQIWYQKHLNAPVPQGRRGAAAELRTEANCKVPRGADKTWPALEVDGMYRAPPAGVTFLEQPYKLGDTRAVMIDGPSHEAIELVEMK